jgi:hypothetical protein
MFISGSFQLKVGSVDFHGKKELSDFRESVHRLSRAIRTCAGKKVVKKLPHFPVFTFHFRHKDSAHEIFYGIKMPGSPFLHWQNIGSLRFYDYAVAYINMSKAARGA